MKRLLLTTLSLSLLAGPVTFAQNYQPQGQGPQHTTSQHTTPQHSTSSGGHQWHAGDRFTGQRRVVSNWNQYHLRQPPTGYQWVQDGNQFVLLAIATGIISSVILNAQ